MSGGDQETTDSEDPDSLAPCNNNINTQGLQQGTRPFDHDVEDNKRFSSSSSDDDGDIVGRHHEADRSDCYTIQSIIRTGRISPGGTDGNLLRAQSDGSLRIDVDFTGTDPNDPTTDHCNQKLVSIRTARLTQERYEVFYLENNDNVDGNVLRYRGKDVNYYLRVYNSEVKLRKTHHFPTTSKFLFRVESVHGRDSSVTFKSVKTGEHLHCDENGKAFMKRATTDGNGKTHDRQAWFRLHPCPRNEMFQLKEDTEHPECNSVSSKNENFENPQERNSEATGEGNTVDGEKENCWGERCSEGTVEGSSQNDEVVDSEETANGYTEDLEEKNSEDPDKRNFEACEDENGNDEAGRGEGREGNSEDSKKGNSGVPGNMDSEVPDEKEGECEIEGRERKRKLDEGET